MTRFYIAASWADKEMMRTYAHSIVMRGHIVTSRWLDSEHETDFDAEVSAHAGDADLEDIRRSEAVLLFTKTPSTTGGLHVEFGYALGICRTIVIIGPRTNIFHKQILCQYKNWDDFRRHYPL